MHQLQAKAKKEMDGDEFDIDDIAQTANFEVSKAGDDPTRRKSVLPGQKTDDQKAQMAAVSSEKLGTMYQSEAE